MWNDCFLDAATNLKEREIFLVEPVSSLLKLVCNLKHLSCKQFHNIVKADPTFLRSLRKLQNIHGCSGHTSATTRNSTKSQATAPEESTWWKVETQNASIRNEEGSASLVKSVKAQIASNWL